MAVRREGDMQHGRDLFRTSMLGMLGAWIPKTCSLPQATAWL
eukprot:CAMPEP_0171061906 /NCGR_PEP_ID=MMETSP0766_2-20121228/4742_1 /TAXON_ID=439317 /ORGANISM="Gambierdiscus australes, Strain CAWD 149" /LENGTH=41 /DNA_ID= /DNA_START= /DNA_END= /DNA_ORIENTATION=